MNFYQLLSYNTKYTIVPSTRIEAKSKYIQLSINGLSNRILKVKTLIMMYAMAT